MNPKLKITRIKDLIVRLEAGDNVSSRALSRVLSETQMKTLEEEWGAEKAGRKVDKPKAIKKYEALIKNTILLYGRGDRMCFEKVPKHKITAMFHKADSAFEAALEHLQEAIDIDGSMSLWIDRNLKDASCCPVGIPRVIGSSSFECLDKRKTPYPTLTKRQLKVFALEDALAKLEPETNETEEKTITIACPTRKALNFEGFAY